MRRRRRGAAAFAVVLAIGFLALSVCPGSSAVVVYATENLPERTGEERSGETQLEAVQRRTEEALLEESDLREIDAVLKDIFPEKKVTFRQVLDAFLDGKETISPELLADYITDTAFYVVKANRGTLLYLLMIMIVAAVFSNFADVFRSRQIAQTGFYLVYVLLITSSLHTFQVTAEVVSDGIEKLILFMEVLSPAYFICMAAAVGSVTSIAFYNLVLVLILLVELVLLHFVLPLIHVCLMMQILNFLSEEEYLSKFAELLRTIIGWSMKTLLAVVTGAGIVQRILSPSVDAVKRSVFTRGAEMIPGAGDVFGGVTEVVLGTAVLIKNGIGMAGAVIVAGICLAPVLNMGVLTLMYKGLAAIVQPVSDKRIVEAVSSVGDGYQMLLKVVCTAGVLFLITIGVAAAAAA